MEREDAVQIKEQDLMPAETVTVVMSQAGWIRAAKGEVDASKLNYRAGDEYLSHAVGKTNQRVYVLDEAGRSYALPIASLPSARGLGEPLSSRLSPASGINFQQLLIAPDEQKFIVSKISIY